MVSAWFIDTTSRDRKSVHFAFRSGCGLQPVIGAIGWVVCIALMDLGRIAVVEGAFLQYVNAELTVAKRLSCAAEI